MAPAKRLPALLALLTLAALLSPVAAAQQANASTGATVSTALASYPPGGTVLFTFKNQGAAELNVTSAKLDVYFATSSQPKVSFPVQVGRVAAGAGVDFSWQAFIDGAAAAEGDYFGKFEFTETRVLPDGNTYPWTTWVWVNGKVQSSFDAAWTIKAPATSPPPQPAPISRLAVSVEPATARLGQSIKVTLTNAGNTNLTATPCDIGFTVRLDGSATKLYDSRAGNDVCIQVAQTLAPGATASFTWDQSTATGPARPGAYKVQGHYGSTSSGEASLSIVADTATPPPTTQPPAPASLALTGPREPVPAGAVLQFALTNTGGTAIEGTLGARAFDSRGAMVWTLVGAQVVQKLEPGKSLTFTWDQRLDSGQPAPGGTYVVVATLGGLQASTKVELQGAAAAPPPPAATPGEPAPEKPVVGRIDVGANVSAGVGCHQGDWVSFCLDAGARTVREFKADGRVVLRAMLVPGTGPITVTSEPGTITLTTQGATITVYDSPAGSLRLGTSGAAASVQLTLGESVAASVDKEGATLRAPGFEALLLVQGEGGVSAASPSMLTVDLGAGQDGEAGFVLRAMPPAAEASAPPATVTLGDAALVKAALDAALPQAIASQKVAAEAYIAREGGALKTSVVPYIAAEVAVDVVKSDASGLALVFDVAQPEGRTLVFHLGEGVLLRTDGGFRVLYDGAEIAMASSLADVLDPDDDGLAAEYVLVQGSAGVELVVSVPHFSAHTLTVQSLAAVQALAPYGAIAGFAVMAVAAAYMLRRSKQ